MENNTGKIGCQAGRTKIVDPNDFAGNGSSFNSPVQLEDLNISVILKTYKKGRTVLYKEGTSSNSENSQEVSINFIEGSTVDGKKVLTTKYTDLTTVFEDGQNNEETLGITNIDIDFNSSYAPMVTINFIDVRGSSIFQNESNVSGNGNGNKYSTFFQIPYPIFELEIKGYYGKPVTYCLHMLKFNSKFNSKTGNFEIQCEFIGYTYAMLSDLLIGYLKAIGQTNTGIEKYLEYNQNKSDGAEVITLSELSQRISKINEGIEKTTNDSSNANSYDRCKTALEDLTNIENLINTLGSALVNLETKTTSNDKFTYIIRNTNEFTANENLAIDSYKTGVGELIASFNEKDVGASLDSVEFQNINNKKYTNITKKMLGTNDDDTTLATKMKSPKDLTKAKSTLLTYIDRFYTVSDDLELNVNDLNDLFDKISEARVVVEKSQEEAKKGLANELKTSVSKDLGFDPTVRSMIEMFTAASEVFMECIFKVSKAAEDKGNSERITELKNKFGDVKNTDINEKTLNTNSLYYAWPEYKEKADNDTFIEKYLGDLGVLEHPEKVNELVFIDELLQGFIKAGQIDEETQKDLDAETKTWFPVNPADSVVLVSEEPYSRLEFKTYQDAIRLAVIRGMTYFAYSNAPDSLSTEELKGMGIAEAKAMLRGIEDSKIRQSLIEKAKSSSAIDEFKKIEGNINALSTKVIKEKNGFYYYNYIYDTGSANNPNVNMLIPINKGFEGNWTPTHSELKLLADDEDYIFLTNYSDAFGSGENSGFYNKDLDGGVYLKILTPEEYDKKVSIYEQPEGTSNKNTLILEKLKDTLADSSAGFNTFGGRLGIQELTTIDCGNGEDGPNGLKVKHLFYANNAPEFLSLRRSEKNKSQPTDFKGTFTTTYKTQYYKNGTNKLTWSGGDYLHTDSGKNLYLLKKISEGAGGDVTYPYIEVRGFMYGQFAPRDYIEPYSMYTFSLFGSKLYYAQKTQYAKAFLFLNTLPFKKGYGVGTYGPFGDPEIKHLFDTRAAFIEAPKLWCAWVGSILWRYSTTAPIKTGDKQTGGGSGTNDPIFTTKDGVNEHTGLYGETLDKTEYYDILDWGNYGVMSNLFGEYPVEYEDITYEDLLVRLPYSVKIEFKRIFFEFVNGEGQGIKWDTIREYLEIWTGSSTAFNAFLDARYDYSSDNEESTVSVYTSNPNFKNGKEGKSYVTIAPVIDEMFGDGETNDGSSFLGKSWNADAFHLELAGSYSDNNAVQTLINALDESVILMNTNYRIWNSGKDENNDDKTNKYDAIEAPKDVFDIYFNSLITTLKDNGDDFTEKAQNDRILNSIFGTTNLPTIKLLLYKHCKNIHDKWLAGVDSEDKIMYQCGNKRSDGDSKIATKYFNTNPKFIDTFRFVSRSFEDIGDLLYIDPTPLNDYLISNQNTSMYDATSSLLNANKFEFIALPTYVNFRNDEELKSIFTPYGNYSEAISNGSCGPSFVSVYTGEKSKHLAIANADYPNDSFDLRCDGSNLSVGVPEDFTKNANDYEDPVGVFIVKYSQQNQNIFKDIVLDQSEFTETEESLQIVEDISQKGSDTNRSFAGQNLYNTYSLRSYTANVEMMGNAMIQPMMYFQLDNIPMFHGAYMITQVKHSIKPNNMSTNFKGVRIKYSKTKLIDAMDLYMSLIDGLNTENSNNTGLALPKSGVAPIVKTIVQNGGLNSNIVAGEIKQTKVSNDIPGISFEGVSNPTLLDEAVEPLREMLKDWAKWLESQGFKALKKRGSEKIYAYVTSMFRENTYNSPHGWGIAVDLQFPKKDGSTFPNTNETGSKAEYFNFETNQALGWMYRHAYEYGFAQPYWANDGNKLGAKAGEEHWHWEYHGKSAICMLRKRPIPGAGNNKTDVNPLSEIKDSKIKSFVHNPKTPDKKEAVYKDCEYITVSESDVINNINADSKDEDYWALLAICSLEGGLDQSRADVAQSVYNRYNTPGRPYGKTIKEIITTKNQYEPTFKNISDWKAIKDQKTAVIAVKNSKKITKEKALAMLNKTHAALTNETLQKNARDFVGTRTEFLAYSPKKDKNLPDPLGIIHRTSPSDSSDNGGNNYYHWRYANYALMDKKPRTSPSVSFA